MQSGNLNGMPQIASSNNIPAVPNTSCTSNATIAPIYAPVSTTNSGNQRSSQTDTHPPAAVTFSNIPTTGYYNPSVPPPPFNSNTTFVDNQPMQQTFINNAPLSSTIRGHTNNETHRTHNSNSTQLQQSNISARQSVPKELPTFTGNPEDWPLFISTFEWSNDTCCFTNAENLVRLQKALKADALHSVQHMLVHPSNVPGVIDVLRLLYGQPEKILNSIKNRINLSPKVDENNLQTFTTFAINVRSLISTINACNLPDEINNSFLLHQLMQKLPPSYQMQWATLKMQLVNQNKKPNLSAFDNWLFSIGLTASSITIEPTTSQQSNNNSSSTSGSNISSKRSPNNNKTTTYKRDYVHTHSDERNCVLCNNNCKTIASCQKYQSLDRGEKWSVVRKYKLCKFCLCKHNDECRRKKKCGKEGCEYFHHSSLHRYSQPANDNNITSNDNVNNTRVEEVVHNSHSEKTNDILFKIIPITIYGKHKSVKTFAFIDEGSSISLMDQSIASELQLNGVPNPLCLRWTGGMERSENNSKKIIIEISGEKKRHVTLNVSTVESLNLPKQTLDYKIMSQRYRHLRNLPIISYEDAVPKILIGLNNFNLGISSKTREGAQHEAVAVRTKLGWLIYGTMAEPDTSKHFNFHKCDCSASDEGLEMLVKSFYTLESVGICTVDPLIAEKEKRSINLLNNFTTYKENGHYEVPLLWKYDNFKLPDSFDMALKRLICLERKLGQNIDLYNVFKDTISNYLSKGYIRKLNENEIKRADEKIWYLPIFAVFNKNKPGKSRVVWDAAAVSSGLALKSFLLKGPDLLVSLPSILFKFRQNSVAICGDIQEMFHQVYIRKEDRDVQRFLWRDCNQNKAPDIYVMDVMIFGATCAPSISQYIKNINADKFKDKFPMAAKAIKQNHYVDDLLISVETPDDAISLISDVIYVHRQAGFNIRNWISNSLLVKQAFPAEISHCAKCINFKDESQVEKVLGVFWEHQDDVITFKIASWLLHSDLFSFIKSPTKREMLRLVMSIYDPLGLIGHIIMYVKVLMQDVWRSKIDWDEPIPPELITKWNQWVKIVPDIQNIKIQRCYLKSFSNYDGVEIQLHTFVDASKDGYAAVSYFRLKKDDIIICSIVGAKTRVAPMKITSVPRLELMAALIGARFAKYISENHEIQISKKYFWCDSKTVLSWINSDHRKYHQFVAFRITEILELSSIKEWNWVPSKQNVADDATKWSRIPNISNSSRWFSGPEFIFQPEEQWPQTEINSVSTEDERIQHILQISKYESLFNTYRFSKWTRLIRAAAYVLRFINICRKNKKLNGEFTQEELTAAENLLYRQAQIEKYNTEISSLKSNIPITKSSDIYSKSPYLDNDILRVDGRIDMADISAEQKRPVILPRKSYITQLIFLHYHEKFYHINHETVINELRQKYSIARMRATYKKIIRCCQMCKINKAVPQIPQMAKLPLARVASYAAPFTYTGVDFFGPILVTVNRLKEKRYGCLFTCLTIRAVHIEVAHSLTTCSCILAIRNFMARRGIPLEFYSDNGTNFVGAERELREALIDVDRNELVKTFTTATTKWIFNPPASPHMGGAWERLVRSVKTILYKIMPSRHPTEELLISMLIEVENIINSRPLAYVPIEENTAEAITPNHFLVGSSSGLKPLSTCSDSGTVLRQNWLISQQYGNIFWKKWLAEYLPSLTCRSKWHEKSKPLSQGDLVIIVDPSLPRNVWLLGKVLQTRLANDGQVRSAKVLTQRGILERPVTKLAILDVAPQKKSGGDEASGHTAGGMLAPSPKSP